MNAGNDGRPSLVNWVLLAAKPKCMGCFIENDLKLLRMHVIFDMSLSIITPV